MREEVIKLIQNGKKDEKVIDYVNAFYDKFYLYIKNDKLLGYADYYTVGDTLIIYNMICKGNIFEMWAYCKNFMKEHNLKHIEFKRIKYNKRRCYGRRR